MGSRVLPVNFQLATPFHTRLKVRHGTDRQTDEQIDRRRQSVHHAPPYGAGHNNAVGVTHTKNIRMHNDWSCGFYYAPAQGALSDDV